MARPKNRTISDGVPIQAYVPAEVIARFRDKYPEFGSVSKLIRKALLLAIEDSDRPAEPWPKDKHGRSMCPLCGKYANYLNHLPPAPSDP